jgi:hypothetical protein
LPLCFAQAPGRLRQSTSQFGQVSRLRGRSHNYVFNRTCGEVVRMNRPLSAAGRLTQR